LYVVCDIGRFDEDGYFLILQTERVNQIQARDFRYN